LRAIHSVHRHDAYYDDDLYDFLLKERR